MIDWYVFYAQVRAFLDTPISWLFVTASFNLFVTVQILVSLSRRSANYQDIRPAALWRRSCALMIDILLLCSAAYWIDQLELFPRFIPTTMNTVILVGAVLLSLPVFVVVNAVHVYFISGTRRGTPGMILMRIEIVQIDGSRLTFRRAFLRNIALVLNLFLFGFGIFSALFSKWNQTMHDQMAGTLVVRA